MRGILGVSLLRSYRGTIWSRPQGRPPKTCIWEFLTPSRVLMEADTDGVACFFLPWEVGYMHVELGEALERRVGCVVNHGRQVPDIWICCQPAISSMGSRKVGSSRSSLYKGSVDMCRKSSGLSLEQLLQYSRASENVSRLDGLLYVTLFSTTEFCLCSSCSGR